MLTECSGSMPLHKPTGTSPCTQCIQCVLSGGHALMVVHLRDAPELVFPVADDIPDDAALLATAAMPACVA
jgi:hypothetical protein